MYTPVFWQDRVVEYPRRVSVEDEDNGLKTWSPAPGEVIYAGTPQSATNFGNMDFGTMEMALQNNLITMMMYQAFAAIEDVQGQFLEVTLANTLQYPATNAIQTVALANTVNNTDYTVQAEIVDADGPVEYVDIYDKALNGFKVSYAGSASSVTLRLHVIGGLY